MQLAHSRPHKLCDLKANKSVNCNADQLQGQTVGQFRARSDLGEWPNQLEGIWSSCKQPWKVSSNGCQGYSRVCPDGYWGHCSGSLGQGLHQPLQLCPVVNALLPTNLLQDFIELIIAHLQKRRVRLLLNPPAQTLVYVCVRQEKYAAMRWLAMVSMSACYCIPMQVSRHSRV